jgi:hypothetical protein
MPKIIARTIKLIAKDKNRTSTLNQVGLQDNDGTVPMLRLISQIGLLKNDDSTVPMSRLNIFLRAGVIFIWSLLWAACLVSQVSYLMTESCLSENSGQVGMNGRVREFFEVLNEGRDLGKCQRLMAQKWLEYTLLCMVIRYMQKGYAINTKEKQTEPLGDTT